MDIYTCDFEIVTQHGKVNFYLKKKKEEYEKLHSRILSSSLCSHGLECDVVNNLLLLLLIR